MESPARAANRVLLGLGLGLLLATGFAFQAEWLPPTECEVATGPFPVEDTCRELGQAGWLLPLAALITLGLALWGMSSVNQGRLGPFGRMFPLEGEFAMRQRIATELDEATGDGTSSAWARLEATLRREDAGLASADDLDTAAANRALGREDE